MTGGAVSLGNNHVNGYNGFLPDATFIVARGGGAGTATFSGTSSLVVYGATRIGDGAGGLDPLWTGVDLSSQGALTLSGSATMTTGPSWYTEGVWGAWFLDGSVVVGDNWWNQGISQWQGPGSGTLTVTENASLAVDTTLRAARLSPARTAATASLR